MIKWKKDFVPSNWVRIGLHSVLLPLLIDLIKKRFVGSGSDCNHLFEAFQV